MSEMLGRRLLQLAGVAVIGVAFAGFVTGTRPPVAPGLPAGERGGEEAPPALAYAELRGARRGPNGTLYDRAFEAIRRAGPGLFDEVAPQDEPAKAHELEQRRARRAYAGAPPTVPHAMQEMKPGECLTCHATGAEVGGLRAPQMSHAPMTMCSQCHAGERTEHADVDVGDVSRESLFVGAVESVITDVAWPGAPPTIPHGRFMRENCGSCHGRHGAAALRTPHPYRENCQQCHASAAMQDQRRPPPVPGGS